MSRHRQSAGTSPRGTTATMSLPSITTAHFASQRRCRRIPCGGDGVPVARSSRAGDLLQMARPVRVDAEPRGEAARSSHRSSGSGRPRRLPGWSGASAGSAPPASRGEQRRTLAARGRADQRAACPRPPRRSASAPGSGSGPTTSATGPCRNSAPLNASACRLADLLQFQRRLAGDRQGRAAADGDEARRRGQRTHRGAPVEPAGGCQPLRAAARAPPAAARPRSSAAASRSSAASLATKVLVAATLRSGPAHDRQDACRTPAASGLPVSLTIATVSAPACRAMPAFAEQVVAAAGLRHRQKQLALQVKRPAVDAGDIRCGRRHRHSEIKLDQMLREGRGMGRTAARAGHDDPRRPAPQPRGQLGQRLGQRAGLPRHRLRRLPYFVGQHHLRVSGSPALSTPENPERVARVYRRGHCMQTERPSPRYSAIDLWDPADILDAMLEGQFAAVAAVHAARPALERAALAIEDAAARRRAAGLCRRRHLGSARGTGRRRVDADLQLARGAADPADGGRP